LNHRRAQHVIDFIETLRCPDGASAGQLITLRPWQKDFIRSVYEPMAPDGLRRIREAILSIPRKNGKTAIVAGLCLAHLCGPEAIRNGQLYSLSVDREQAGILFKYAAAMVYADEELSARLNVVESKKLILDPVSGSVYTVLSGEKKGKMGKSASVIFFDELAEFCRDRDLYDALMTSRGAHAEPLVFVFSTQAPDEKALLSELIDYGQAVQRGEIEDHTVVCCVYTAPVDADPWDPQTWFDCNPALGDFCSLKTMQEAAAKAQRMPSAEAAFRNLHLNQRIDASAHFITPTVWKASGGEIDHDLFATAKVWGGLDLSGKNDLSSLVYTAEDEAANWHVLPRFWTPGDSLRERGDRDKVPYQLWASQGHLEAVPGKVIDYAYVARAIQVDMAVMNIQGIKFDRWRIADLQRELQEIGVEAWIEGQDQPIPGGLKLVQHGQGFKDMSPAVEIVEDLLASERVRHGMHPVLTMCAANTRVQADPAGGRKFDKLKSTGRIDGIVAMSMALNGAATAVDTPSAEVWIEHWD
jgi:phage terminase large subunit-like protein